MSGKGKKAQLLSDVMVREETGKDLVEYGREGWSCFVDDQALVFGEDDYLAPDDEDGRERWPSFARDQTIPLEEDGYDPYDSIGTRGL